MTIRLTLTCLLTAACAAPSARAADLVWLETERFDNPGGWTEDSQFIDQMGSPYLMAIGLGTPVEDAATRAALPRPGRYRLWARTRDWVPDHHPGRFQILLDGKPVERTFGANGRQGWHWEEGGVHQLGGAVELRLHDLTGFYGRCDAIVLCDDLQWTPPEEVDQLAALRKQHGGLSAEVKEMGRYDVVVVGGGLAGCMAAVSSARMGCSTVLIQDRPMLGGNTSTEILVPPVGVWPHAARDPLDPRETGLLGEIRTEGNQKVAEAKLYSGRLLRLVKAEPNLDLFLNTHATGVEMKSASKIDAVLAVDVHSGQRMRFVGRVFIDCTGDSVVGVSAGAEYRHGKEPASTYNESLADEQASRQTMGNSLKYVSQPTGKPQPYVTPPWAMKFEKPEDIPPSRKLRLGGDIGWQWALELGGKRDTYADAEEIRDDVLRLIFGLWGYVKHHSPELREKATDHKLVWVAHVAGKRENRRLLGDYVLHQNDISEQTMFPDRVAYGGWGVDDHPSDGFFYRYTPGGPRPVTMFCKGILHSIPFRSLYSKNVDNLLMAGRNASASHVAMAATRVMMTCALMGHAAGTGAALCVQHDRTPRGVCHDYLDELQQQLLKDGAYIIEMPNRDPRDLARSAAVTASSESTSPDGQRLAATNVTNGYARAERGKTNAWFPDPEASAPAWVELAWKEPHTFNVVHVTFPTKDHAPAAFQVQARQDGAWKTLAELTGCRHQRYTLGLERTTASRLRVVLGPRQFLGPAISEIRVYDEPERVVQIARHATANMLAADDKPDLPWDDRLDGCSGLDPRKLPGIVLDDTEAAAGGHWVESTYTDRFIFRGYRHDANAGQGTKVLRFTPNVPSAGKYELRLAYSAYTNRASNVPVTIDTGEASKMVRVDQRKAPPIDGMFLSLGTFDLKAGHRTTIAVTNDGTDGYVTVDAIQLLPASRK